MVEFGRFRLDAHRRELLADGLPVPVGSRAFDILIALVEAGGELVTKDELLHSVWSGAVVEEHNLQFQISTLRKALGPDRDFIKTISGRGYRFVAKIINLAMPEKIGSGLGAPLVARHRGAFPASNLPASTSDLVGLDAAVQQLQDLLAERRAVTLTGPGGIGKTTLALEAARRVFPAVNGDVWLVELASLSDPGLVASAVADALGLQLANGKVFPETVARAIGERKLLLVLDNCEHVIDAAANLAETVVRLCPATSILATSREILRIAGECVYGVPPLDVPPPHQDRTDLALEYGAVQLFVARAQALRLDFSPHDENLSAIAAICRRLDGIPLAIEFAAARAATIGVQQVASGLDDRFKLLTGGRRPALPRHQTLRATLDWSYELLPEQERRLLRHLAVFPGGFTPEAATAIISEDDAAPAILGGIASLVAKSLVTLNVSATATRWRLLETTRAYALDRLSENGERDVVARRHAEYYRDLFQRAAGESETRPAAEWLAAYGIDIDNVRATLDWAFSPLGDSLVGIALTLASVPHWFQLSRMEECRERVEQALAIVGSGANQDEYLRMQLLAAYAVSLMMVGGDIREAGKAWEEAIKLAEAHGQIKHRLRMLWGLWGHLGQCGELRAALARAEQFFALAADASDPAAMLIGDLVIGIAQHFLGNQTDARSHIEHMLEHYPDPPVASHTIDFLFGQQEIAWATLARVLWLQGFPDQAMHAVRRIAEKARSFHHLPTACNVLVSAACPIALLVGDLAAAEYFLSILFDRLRNMHGHWNVWGQCAEGMLLIRRGDFPTGLRQLRTGLDKLHNTGAARHNSMFHAALAQGLADSGRVSEGLASIHELLARCSRNEELWCLAELLRIKGALVLEEGTPAAAAVAEDSFLQAIDVARQQGVLSWELRCATSLARMWHEQGRNEKACALLSPVYDRFTEGFQTADLRSARTLLDLLRSDEE
jgi:predicted ATPase/DNA-binding winged helix-turn-helix (wHTH) protein